MFPRVRAGLPRRRYRLALLASFALLAAPAAATAQAQSAPYDEAGYWEFADRIQLRLDDLWDAQAGYYRAGSGGVEPMMNSMMLLTHAVAATRGHEGPARADARARALTARLVSSPPFVERPGSAQAHAPGWVNSMSNPEGDQHLVFDAEVVDGLVHAYRARRALGLPDATVHKVRSAIHRTARSAFWRWPTVRLNQINWYALMYAADATVTGDGGLLRHDLALQLRRFTTDVRQTDARAGNFGAGMRFHYLPDSGLDHPMNVDSAEYSEHRARLHALLRPGAPRGHARAERVAPAAGGRVDPAGAGGLLDPRRLHELGLRAGLPSLAPGEEARPQPARADRRGLRARPSAGRPLGPLGQVHARSRIRPLRPRRDARARHPAPVFFALREVPQGAGSARLAAARMQANAARAIAAGLGRMRAATPPPLYAYDPDIGRLAVTTPAYNTAIVAVSQRAFPYGGLDLARLFDADQDVAANVGGSAPASFGAIVRDGSGHRVLASQMPRRSIDRAVTPLRLLRAPHGAGATAATSTGRAFPARSGSSWQPGGRPAAVRRSASPTASGRNRSRPAGTSAATPAAAGAPKSCSRAGGGVARVSPRC